MPELKNFDSIDIPGSIDSASLPRTCIVTGELVGLYKNGGLGTSMTGVAELLAAHGAEVTVLYTGLTGKDTDEWVRKYESTGIKLEILSRIHASKIGGPLEKINWVNAWHVYQTLRSRSFDVIHFNDTLGEGAYCFLAKEFGISFENSLLTLAVHSPIEWIFESNREVPRFHFVNACKTGEQISISLTDLLWGPSEYLLSWLEKKGYQLPENIYQQQYVIPGERLFEPGREKLEKCDPVHDRSARSIPNEIVFFGRLEERKGIRVFCAAVSSIHKQLEEKGVSVLFMGKQSYIDDMGAAEFISERARDWACSWRIESSFGQQQAISYLKQSSCLAVMASPVDNSPCTVYEALIHGFPFIAARTGGIPELINPHYHDRHLFNYSVDGLSHNLIEIIENGIGIPEPSRSVEENRSRWMGFHINWKKYLPPGRLYEGKGHIWAVYIDHIGELLDLEQTIASISTAFNSTETVVAIRNRNQSKLDSVDIAGVEILDEIKDKEAFEILDGFIRSGATRLLSLRSGIVVRKDSRHKLDEALEGKADSVVPAITMGEQETAVPSHPGCASLAFLENQFDEGILAFDLQYRKYETIKLRLSNGRPHFGLRDELISAGANLWPYPDILAHQSHLLKLCVDYGDKDKTLTAFSAASRSDICQLLAIASQEYVPIDYPFSAVNSKSVLRRYLFSNPTFVKKVFGNRYSRQLLGFTRKAVLFLNRVSNQH